MQFELRALAPDQRVITLRLQARDEAQARELAAGQALQTLSVRVCGGASFFGGRGRPRFSLLLFCQELLALLEAGLSVIEALEAMEEGRGNSTASDLAGVLAQSLRQGQRLSQAMTQHAEYFPPLFTGLMGAAEKTSDLPAALRRFVVFESRLDTVRAKVVSATIYPALLLVVGGAVTAFLLGYVVPRFASVYEDTGRSMSALTAGLLAVGRFIEQHALMLGGVAVLLLFSAVIFYRQFGARLSVTAVLERLPGLGPRVQSYALSRLYMTTGLLLAGGIPLVQALGMVEASLGPRLRRVLVQAIARVQRGEGFSAAMAAEGLAGPVALRLLRVGEHAGNLGEMMLKAAHYHDSELDRYLERFTRVAEPLLMTAIGVVVGTIVVLLYLPIFELAGSLQ